MDKLNKAYIATGIVIATILGTAAGAFAQTSPPTPQSVATDLTTTAVTDMIPVIVAVATGFLSIALVAFAVRAVYRKLHHTGAKV